MQLYPIPHDHHAGGFGGNCRFTIRESRLVERAVREYWPIPEALRGRVTDRLGAIVDDAKASPRAVTAAALALLGASRINLEGVAATVNADEYESLRDRVAAVERSRLTWSPLGPIPR